MGAGLEPGQVGESNKKTTAGIQQIKSEEAGSKGGKR